MSRPIEIATRYLADTRDGLDRLIRLHTQGKKVVRIEVKYVAPTTMFGRNQATVITLEDPIKS